MKSIDILLCVCYQLNGYWCEMWLGSASTRELLWSTRISSSTCGT